MIVCPTVKNQTRVGSKTATLDSAHLVNDGVGLSVVHRFEIKSYGSKHAEDRPTLVVTLKVTA